MGDSDDDDLGDDDGDGGDEAGSRRQCFQDVNRRSPDALQHSQEVMHVKCVCVNVHIFIYLVCVCLY